MWAVPTAFNSVLVAMRIIILENLSTITRTALYPCDSGSGLIRSIEMCSQGFEGIACGGGGLGGFSQWFLVLWHGSHSLIYRRMVPWIRGHQQSLVMSSWVLYRPGCPATIES